MIWTQATFCRYCKSEIPQWKDRTAQQLQPKFVTAGWTTTIDDAEIDRIFDRMMRKRK